MKRVCKCLFPAMLSLIVLIPQFTGLAAAQPAEISSPSSKVSAQTMSLGYGKTYYLRNAKSGMYLDLKSSGYVNGTNFQQYPGHYPSELFYFNYQGGYYTVETTLVGASGRMVMDGRKNCVAGAQVVLYQYVSDATEQLWFVRQNSNGTYSLSPKKNSSLNLAVEGGSGASNAKVKLAAKSSSDLSQQWYLEEPVEKMRIMDCAVYYLRNRNSGLYLDLQGNGTTNGTHFQQYPFYSSPCAERFVISSEDDGYFSFQSTIANRMVMDGRNNCVAGAQVVLYQIVSSAPEQHWHLRRNRNGTFCISPKKNVYLNLAVAGGSYDNNAKIILTDRNDADPNQQWCLEPVDIADHDWAYVFKDAETFSKITSGYKLPDRRDHCAIDIMSKKDSVPIKGQQIRTPMDGEVVYTSPNIYSCGYYVVVETDCFYVGTGERIRVGFMHMQGGSFYDPGDRVEKWDNLQNVGNSGTSDGFNHLDLSVFLTGEWAEKSPNYNPQRFFPDVPFTGKVSSAD